MKQYKVQLTPRARTSINEIISNLRESVSASYATKVRKEILVTIKNLKTFPEAHQAFDELSDGSHEYRRALTLNYKIVFTVNEDILEVVVVQVYNQRRSQKWIDDNV
jgi:plasmid stabilization system protein ParE